MILLEVKSSSKPNNASQWLARFQQIHFSWSIFLSAIINLTFKTAARQFKQTETESLSYLY